MGDVVSDAMRYYDNKPIISLIIEENSILTTETSEMDSIDQNDDSGNKEDTSEDVSDDD